MPEPSVLQVPPEFKKIFAGPIGVVDDYTRVPEYRGVQSFPDHSPPPEDYEVQVLGCRPEVLHFQAAYRRTPEPRLYELAGPLWYDGLVFSASGEIFVDSARMYREEPLSLSFYLGQARSPRVLEDGHVLMPPPLWEGAETKHYHGAYMPFFTIHAYGHYLIECASLLWALEQGLHPTLILHNSLERVPGRVLGLTEPFGLDEGDFLIPEPYARFETLFMPRRSYMHGHYFGLAAKRVFRRIGQYYADRDQSPWPRRIYLSRRGIPNRRLLNEAECEDVFRRHGFTVIAPEELTVAQQAALFARASHVAGPQGTALHNRVFSLAPEKLKLMILAAPPLIRPFPFIEKAYGLTAALVMGEAAFQPPDHYNESTWTMPLDNLKIGLRQWLEM